MPENKDTAIQKLEAELATKEAELQACYNQMGKSLLELAGTEQKTVNRLVDEIIKRKRKLAHAKNERQCTECGLYSDSDSRYCRHCGAKLPSQSKQRKETE